MLLPPWASQGRGSCCFFFRIGYRSWILLPLSCVFKRWIEFEHWACHDGEVWPLIQILAEASFHWPLSTQQTHADWLSIETQCSLLKMRQVFTGAPHLGHSYLKYSNSSHCWRMEAIWLSVFINTDLMCVCDPRLCWWDSWVKHKLGWTAPSVNLH